MHKDQIYIASSVAARSSYCLIETARLASKYGFSGIQAYLSPAFLEKSYLDKFISLLRRDNLDVIIHLPNNYSEEFVEPVKRILTYSKDKKALIHYSAGMKIPKINKVKIGLENSVFGYDKGYYQKLDNVLKKGNYFYTFDIPRLFGRKQSSSIAEMDHFINTSLDNLQKRDLLHLIDQKNYSTSRNGWCSLGEGVMKAYLERIRLFSGIVILEYEDIVMAVKSRKQLLVE